MSTSEKTLSESSWYKITEDATKGEKRHEFVAGKPSDIHISTGTLEMELHGKHLSEFSSQPAEFIRKVLQDDGRVVNGVRAELPEETVKTLAKSRALGWGVYGAKWYHIDQPPEEESTWVCIDIEKPKIHMMIGW